MTTEEEIGVKWPQAKGHLESQELEEAGRILPFLPLPEGAQPCPHLDLWPAELGGKIFLLF